MATQADIESRPFEGRRRRKLSAPGRCYAIVLLALALSVSGAVQAAGTSEWRMWRADPQNSGRVDLTIFGDLGRLKAWRFRGGSHVWGYKPGMSVWSSAAVATIKGRATVFVGSYDHNLYALDAITGARRFRYTTGGGVYATPAIWRNPGGEPLVFFTSADRAIYAAEADLGRRVWVYTVKTWRPTIGGARLSSPAIGRVGETAAVFFGHWVWDKSLAGHLQAGGVTALEAATGRKLWTTELGDNQISSPIVADVRGQPRVFVASENGNLYALSAKEGRVLWSQAQRNVVKASPALYREGGRARVIIGSKHGLLRCFDASAGTLIWQFKAGHWIDGSAAVGVVDGRAMVFFGSYDTSFYGLDARSGRALWRHHTAGGIFSSAALLFDAKRKRDDVLFASWDHHLYDIAAEDGSLHFNAYTGRPLWDSISLGDSIWASPAVALLNGQAMIYYGSYSGPFFATPLEAAAKEALAHPGSNIHFWLTLPLVLLVVSALLVGLSRRQRRLEAARQKAASSR